MNRLTPQIYLVAPLGGILLIIPQCFSRILNAGLLLITEYSHTGVVVLLLKGSEYFFQHLGG